MISISQQFTADVFRAATEDGDAGLFLESLGSAGSTYEAIYASCGNQFRKGCGSYLFDGQTYTYCSLMRAKQQLLWNQARPSKTNSLLEIGVYMGHSLLIALLANPTLKITCIDNSDEFAKPAVSVLQEAFPDSTLNFIHSDSISALKSLEAQPFDLVHIDGSHLLTTVETELELVREKFTNRRQARIIFDDQWSVRSLINALLTSDKVTEYQRPFCSWPNAYLALVEQPTK
jgi:hypothetical protein